MFTIAMLQLASCGNAAQVDPSLGFTTDLAGALLKARDAGMVWDSASITQITDAAAKDNCPHPDLSTVVSGFVEMGPGALAGLDGAAQRQQLEPRGPYEFLQDLADNMNAFKTSNRRQLKQTSCCDEAFGNYCDNKCGSHTKCGGCARDCNSQCMWCLCCIECIDACTKPAAGYSRPCTDWGGEACSAEIKTCKEEKEKKAEEEELAGILIGVGVGVLIIVGIIVGVSCYCKKARNIAPSGTVQGVAMPAQPGVQSQPQPAVQSQPQQQGKAAQLKELKELLDAGALTQDEFDSQKKEVLAGKS